MTPETIHERNRRVELDKAWETSLTRRACIATITYAAAAAFLYHTHSPTPLLSACIPTAGYLLGTLTLSPIKNIWLRHNP